MVYYRLNKVDDLTISPIKMDGLNNLSSLSIQSISTESPKTMTMIDNSPSPSVTNDEFTQRKSSNTTSNAIKRKSLCFDDASPKKQCNDVINEKQNASETNISQNEGNNKQSTNSISIENQIERTVSHPVQIQDGITKQVVEFVQQPKLQNTVSIQV